MLVGSLAAVTLLAACQSASREALVVVTTPTGGIEVRTLEGTVSSTISESGGPGPIQPTPSPDGSKIAATFVDSDGTGRMLVWDGDRVEFDLGFTPFYYAWSPDGSRVAALGNGDSTVTGAVVDLESATVTPIEGATPFFFDWSPDGNRLATFKNGRTIAVESSGGESVVLSNDGGLFQAPQWIDDASLLATVGGAVTSAAYQTASPETERVVRIAVADGAATTVVETLPYNSFALSPDRRRLAVLDGDPATILVGRLRVVPLDGGEPPATIEQSAVVAYQWSPDGRLLLVMSVEGDHLVPAVWDGDTTRTYPGFHPTARLLSEYLPFWGQYVRSLSAWSPASDAFVYAAEEAGADVIRVQRLSEDAPVEVGSGGFASWAS
jgi:Tol biopolymer transport system component